MLGMFVDQIETLYPILDAPAAAPSKPSQQASRLEKATFKFLDHVFKNSDKKLPFRDKAISRRRVLEDGGPFSEEHMRTRRAFFSVMVHRGITHHSRFLTEHGETIFEDLTDFEDTVKSYGKRDSTFFCDPSAYGMWTRLRVSTAGTYWRSSGKAEHLRWLTKHGNERIEFSDLLRKFTSTDFPNIGPLIGYLIASDYAIAGIAKIPTAKDMGGIIHDIGKGGLAGLMTLGFKCESREATAAAFEVLYTEMLKRIPYRRRQEMDFNVFVLEHMLCKFKRLSTKLYKDVVSARSH